MDDLKTKEHRCLVCNEKVLYQNFGTVTCNGCAAFFRRTIQYKKRYICRQSMDCNILEAKHKRRCPYCRFQRCINIGMDVTKILVRLSNESENPLRKFVVCRRANYTSRRKHAINLFDSLSNYESMKDQPRDAKSLIRATVIEKQVMQEYFRNVGIIEPELWGTPIETEFCSILLHSWLVFESVLFTRLHSGHEKKQLYYPDESFIKLNENNLVSYYKSNHSLRDPELVARSSQMLLQNVLKSALLLETMEIDEHETASLFVLLLLRAVTKRIGANKKAQEWVNQTFKQLGYYYRNTLSDFPKRLGQLVLCLESIEETDRCLDELALIVQLQYKTTDSSGYKMYVRGQLDN
ncbi:Steroidogenic factor 1, protein [Aphelenchoides bicaudatus]|nr:Steroidogenic factor 1, protein [Aphelenchoides bicaudatus]